MSYSNGLLHSSSSRKTPQRGLPGVGFELTDDGNYDIDGKRLTNVAEPVDGKDATTRAYVDGKTGHHTGNLYHLRQSFEFYDSSGTKLALSTDNITGLLSDYKHGYYKISKDSDESTYSKVSIEIKNNLPNSTYSALFYLYGYNNNNIMTGDDLGPILFGARGINYHVLWYTDDDDSLQTKNHAKGIIWFTADGDGSIEIELRFFDKSITHFLVFSRCVGGKVNLGFSIDIFNVAHNSSGTFYFEDIDMNNRKINNLGDPTDGGDAANKKFDIENARQNIAIADKASILYVNQEIAKVNTDTTPLLPRNGSRSMFGDLDMDGNHILSVENLDDYKDTDSYEYRVKDLKSVVNKEYLNENFLKKVDKDGREYYLKQIVIKNSAPHDDGSYDNDTLVSKAFVDAEIAKLPKPDTDVLKLDGSKAMTGDLNMNNNEIKNLKDPQPSDASYAASVNFVNKTVNGSNVIISGIIDNKIQESEVRSIQSVQQENFFKKVMTDNLFKEDDDKIEFLSTINYNLLHHINHLTYLFRIKKDLSESYNGRLSIDLRYLPTGTYTMVFEMKFFPQIDHDKVSVNAVSSSLNRVSTKTRVINFDYGYYSRSIINFQKLFTNPGIDDLDIDLHLSLKDSVSPKPDKTPINVTVYGVRGTHSDIPIQTWDKLYDINNGTLEFEIPINMNGKAIINLKDPVNDQDAATKKYMETHVSNSHVTSSDKSNAFQYVMNNPSHLIEEDDIEFGGLVTFQSSPHSINKKFIDTKLIFDAGHGYYSSRASINLYVLPNGSYTMAFELIWSSDDVDRGTVSLNGISAVETIHDISNKTFNNYSRLIMQFSKSTDTTPNHLYIDIVIKMKSGKSYPPKLQTYLVCYGVKGLQSDVPSNVYDALWGIDNGVVTFNETINMGNNKITGVADGTNDNDAINKLQFENYNKYYYFEQHLGHENAKLVKFANDINKFPFGTLDDESKRSELILSLEGYYQVIYTDFYKSLGIIQIIDDRKRTLFHLQLMNVANWTPLTINAVINVDKWSPIYLPKINIKATGDHIQLRGNIFSNFYIRYLHP